MESKNAAIAGTFRKRIDWSGLSVTVEFLFGCIVVDSVVQCVFGMFLFVLGMFCCILLNSWFGIGGDFLLSAFRREG